MLAILTCPQCGAPAELTQRLWPDSTCLSKHWRSPSSGPPPDHRFATGSSRSAPAPPAVRASTAGDRTSGGLA